MGTRGSVSVPPALQATLSAEGRTCSAQPMRGSALGSACGPAVVADHADSLQKASSWMPGRILVLCDEALHPDVLTAVLTGPPSFAAVVALTDDHAGLSTCAERTLTIPMVAVTREQDQGWVRRAMRLTVEVRVGPQLRLDHAGPQIVLPRPRRPRRPVPPLSAIPGVVAGTPSSRSA